MTRIEPYPTEEGSLLWTLDEIGRLVSQSGDPSETLTNVVLLIQQRFQTDVCSVYLLEPDRASLVLAATIGLRPDSVGRVRMRLTEGLVGLVAERLEPQIVADATTHPRFKYFPETGEDPHHSFLGVPVIDHGLLQGILVVQTVAPRTYSPDDVRMLTMAGRQLAPVVSEARTFGQFVAPARQRLATLAQNLWWSWDNEATSVFREIDPDLWRECDNNPIALLQQMSVERLEDRVSQLALHSRINYAYRRLQEYLHSAHTWGARHAGVLWARPVAYFSAEFGLHESIPIYSGGLGILAGDHIKSASDLGIPLVGVGLYYDQGYFRQRLDSAGWQQEDYLHVDHARLPMEPARRNGAPVTISIDTRTGPLLARVWKMAVGRNTLLLLDSNVDGNRPEDRELTARLYGGDIRVRVRQELLLGVGGVRALAALGISPGVAHLNEGHSAFAALELLRQRMESEGIDAIEAIRRVAPQVVFTTHTPVPAGHDRFPADVVEEHLGPLRDAIGLDFNTFMGLGRVEPQDPNEEFCMTVLALKLSRRANAVSSLHGQVSRAMWSSLFPNRNEDQIPIGHITNGVHSPTWLAPAMRQVYDRHLGPDWPLRAGKRGFWDAIDQVDDGELWETHQILKVQLIESARRRATRFAERRGEAPDTIAGIKRALSFDALTIGFARRFATYKRAALMLQDVDALAALVNDPRMPVQFIFAGKSHPKDQPGKQLLQQIAQLMRDPRFAGKILFLEDYDINVGRRLVHGVDVWANNPRRPLEACGTSGQKVVLNGGLNLSILDGWWAEAYDGQNGFAIGGGETHTNVDLHDTRDGDALLRVLRDEVIPLYYERDRDGLPRGWIARMKRAIRTLGWRFSADRMVMDYVNNAYIPAAGGTSSQTIPT
ncbi:MAG TPA: alpha-glucan family phosphorylase [Vicinamibacterales bacterium]|nr:alpha-glucan family phosphorylase [Vicinamibacterales bacterium]